MMKTAYPNIPEQDFHEHWINDWILMVVFCSFGGLIGMLAGEVTLPQAIAGSVVIGSLFYALIAFSLWVNNK